MSAAHDYAGKIHPATPIPSRCGCQWALLDESVQYDVTFLAQKIQSCIYDPEFYFTLPKKLRDNAIIIDAVVGRYPHLIHVEEIRRGASFATLQTFKPSLTPH